MLPSVIGLTGLLTDAAGGFLPGVRPGRLPIRKQHRLGAARSRYAASPGATAGALLRNQLSDIGVEFSGGGKDAANGPAPR